MLKYLFWALAVPTIALALLVVVLTLGGRAISAQTPAWLSILAAGSVLALVGWGCRLVVVGQRPGAAIGLTILAWLFFLTTMLVNGLMHQKIWN